MVLPQTKIYLANGVQHCENHWCSSTQCYLCINSQYLDQWSINIVWGCQNKIYNVYLLFSWCLRNKKCTHDCCVHFCMPDCSPFIWSAMFSCVANFNVRIGLVDIFTTRAQHYNVNSWQRVCTAHTNDKSRLTFSTLSIYCLHKPFLKPEYNFQWSFYISVWSSWKLQYRSLCTCSYKSSWWTCYLT